MSEIVSAYEQEIKFVLGFAGSGKSTRLAKDASESTLILTPTHKAAKVLKNKGLNNVFTIHSTLKLVPTINDNLRKGQRLQKIKRMGDTDLSDITEVFIDEFSMISTYILDLLLEVLPDNATVTVFGDPYQLKTIDGDKIYPEDYTADIEHLTTQHRAEAPEVIETFMRFMNYLKNDSGNDLRLNKNIERGDLSTFNPETDRILAYTNKEVKRLNSIVAENLNYTSEYQIGEDLVANGIDCKLSYNLYARTIYPKCMSKGKLKDGDELEECSDTVSADIEKFNTDLSQYATAFVEIEDSIYELYYDTEHYHNNKKLKDEATRAQFYVIDAHNLDKDVNIPKWCSQNKNAEGVKTRGQAWSRLLAHSNLVFSLQRPFATTVHKAQGSQFSTVFIAQGDIKKAIRGNNYRDYARLMYVALSRAINKVVIV